MIKIKVDIEASYGCDCSGCGYGSEDTIEVEVTEQELEALRKIDDNQVSREAVVAAIDGGADVLQSLRAKIEDCCYYEVEEYWLFEAYNECLEDDLSMSIERDIAAGIYTPSVSYEQYVELVKNEEIDFEELQFGCYDELEDDCEDEEVLEYTYESYILNEYYDWVCGNDHDHRFVAERVGVALDACRDEEIINYTIKLTN